MEKIKIAVLVSGSGSNLQSMRDAVKTGAGPSAEIAIVISNKESAYALTRAQQANIPHLLLDPKAYRTREDFFAQVIYELEEIRADMICLAGFLLKLEPNIIRKFKGRILNIHPALLPKYGGKGMYGHFVHEAVLKSGEKESGCSVHVVDEEFDHGPVLLQRKIAVQPQDTPETLAARVLEQEHLLYPEAVKLFIEKEFGK